MIVAYSMGSFGVFDQNGVFVKRSLLQYGKGQYIPPASASHLVPYFDYDVVYLGSLDRTFGHYLLERWDRAYAFLDKKYTNMKFVLLNDMQIKPIPGFVTDLARFLGMCMEDLVILDKSARFRNVYVPESGFKITSFSSREFGEIYAQIADNVKEGTTYDKIYVSRAALTRRKTYGEEKIQKVFEKNGYHIVYPEQLSLEEQIALMKGCKSLAGCAGTALHLALFMPNGGHVIQIKRNKLKDDNCGTQYLIAETKGQSLVFIDASIEKRKTKHFDDYKAQIIGVNEHMRRFFDDSGFKYSPNDVEYDGESWSEYIREEEKLKAEYRERYGKSEFEVWILGRIVMLISSFIPNRARRAAFRVKMRKAWGIRR
ncbi:MAG: glycosyltransferase family 61 protein [Bacteroidales bacterium]|nr:glycosyltransferase family 61 protein [Bacteroidales bacterium]